MMCDKAYIWYFLYFFCVWDIIGIVGPCTSVIPLYLDFYLFLYFQPSPVGFTPTQNQLRRLHNFKSPLCPGSGSGLPLSNLSSLGCALVI